MSRLARRQLAPVALLFAVGAVIPGLALHLYGGKTVMLAGIVQFAGIGILVLSTIPALRRLHTIWPLVAPQIVGVAAVRTLGGLGMAMPTLLPKVPTPGGTAALITLGFGSVFFALLLARALKTYLLTRRRADLAVVVGLAWLTLALPPAVATTWMQLGWWIGHFLEVLGIALVVGAVCLDLRRGRTSSLQLAGDLRAAELVAEEEAFFGARIRALMVKLGEKDDYTEGHTRRVALRAVQLGEELRLPPSRLRGLAIGGLLHDIGKLTVPDGILKKPAKLSDEEFVVIRRHTLWSVELLGELGGFDASVQRLVLDHYERLDGGGYPHRKPAVELGLDTRILRTCDVYDALMTTRVYREAWPHEWAIALLRSETGAAFERVLRREGLHPAPCRGSSAEDGPLQAAA